MNWKSEWKWLAALAGLFLAFFYLPVGAPRFDNALAESLQLSKWYAREHVVLCLLPAFFIAGAISVFISQASVMKYLGAGANKVTAYGVASVSGGILAVCSCTILPLFAGIYRMGAGLGPATAFLYSGPAISVLSVVLTARVLGVEIGTARAVGAVSFSVIIGLIMHFLFRREETEKAKAAAAAPAPEVARPLWQNALYFGAMAAVLVFANWGKSDPSSPFWYAVYSAKWILTAAAAAGLAVMLVAWFGVAWWKMTAAAGAVVLAAALSREPMAPFVVGLAALSLVTATGKGEIREWFDATWGYAKIIAPLLLIGVLAAGFLLGRPGHEGLVPSSWIVGAVGGNSLLANFAASLAGALMYFATLTEVPVIQGLMGSGMGKGPALALLLAGPALSLPSIIVLTSIMGKRKTAVYVALVVAMGTLSGMLYGAIFG